MLDHSPAALCPVNVGVGAADPPASGVELSAGLQALKPRAETHTWTHLGTPLVRVDRRGG